MLGVKLNRIKPPVPEVMYLIEPPGNDQGVNHIQISTWLLCISFPEDVPEVVLFLEKLKEKYLFLEMIR